MVHRDIDRRRIALTAREEFMLQSKASNHLWKGDILVQAIWQPDNPIAKLPSPQIHPIIDENHRELVAGGFHEIEHGGGCW
jgi:hypothetical protein